MPDTTETPSRCRACSKDYASIQGLAKHLQRQPLCADWIGLVPGIKDYVDEKLGGEEERAESTKCTVCNTTFANVGILNRHMDASIICRKWSMHQELEPFDAYMQRNEENEAFVTPAYSLCHIIWNVFLMDKEYATLPNFEEIVAENNIRYVIALLPDEAVFAEKVKMAIDHEVLVYTDHDTALDLAGFDRQCAKIEECRKRRENVFVFCNNGYQRSIPFLCYYLMKYHPSEAPDVPRALDLILPQVDKANYATIRDGYVESMTALFAGVPLV
jgi:hypothetical protein